MVKGRQREIKSKCGEDSRKKRQGHKDRGCLCVCFLTPVVSGGLDLPLNRDFQSAKDAQTGFRTGSFYFGQLILDLTLGCCNILQMFVKSGYHLEFCLPRLARETNAFVPVM